MQFGAQHRIYAGFFMFAFAMGALFSRLADLQLQFGVEEGVLGLTIIGMSSGSLVSLTFSARIVAWLGQKRTFYVTIMGYALAMGLVPLMPNVQMVFAVLFLGGLNIGALEITLNTEADRIEADIGQRIMSRSHGFWSVGFFVSALVSTWVRQIGVSPAVHMGFGAVAVIIATYLVFKGFSPAPVRGVRQEKPPLFNRPTKGILALCAVGAAPILMEGVGLDWSVIYMRDSFAVAPILSGMSLSLFSFFMAGGRLVADGFIERFGPRIISMVLLTMCIVSLLMVVYATGPYIALAGFALMGLGASAVYPIVISAAAQRTDQPAETSVASLTQIVFMIFLIGPPLLGFVAQYFGIRMTYLVCVPVVVASMVFAFRLMPSISSKPVAVSATD